MGKISVKRGKTLKIGKSGKRPSKGRSARRYRRR